MNNINFGYAAFMHTDRDVFENAADAYTATIVQEHRF